MSPRRTRLPTAQRRQQIAEATLKILARRGARELTAQQIAQEVGIKDGSLFRHFASIEAMVTAAIDLFEQRMAESFPKTDGKPMLQLREFFVHRSALVTKHPDVMRLAFNDRLMEVAGQKGTRKVQRMVQRSLGFVRECLEAAQQQGVITAEVPVEVLVWTVTGVIRGLAGSDASGRRRKLDSDQAWHALETLLQRSTSARARPSKARAGGRKHV